MKDYYSTPKGYILNPFKFVYQEPDLPITDVSIQEIIQGVLDINDSRLDLDLNYLEHLLKLDTLAYIRKGCIYADIKFRKLYKRVYSNFDQYAKDVLKSSTRSVVAHIEASRVAIELIMAGFSYEELPYNMSQAYQLSKYTGEELIEKWKYIIAELPPHKRTATSIKELINPAPVSKEELYTKIELPLAVYSKLLKVAYDAKMSVSKLIDNVFSVLTSDFKKQEISRFIKWVLDMNNLLGEM